MSYQPLFDPTKRVSQATGVLSRISPFGVSRGPEVYVDHDRRAVLAVNLALATGRPLLLGGLPGSGKSTLARHVAECLGWEYMEEVVTSRTQARDLQWRFDALRRLRDAQARGEVDALGAYVEPGVLWWAFDPIAATAASTFARSRSAGEDLMAIPGIVVLLDEIDKAEPDVPNDLLIPLGIHRIVVEETAEVIERKGRLLVCITTNGERELPQAFLRRCIYYRLASPSYVELAEIGRRHFPTLDEGVLERVIALFLHLREQAERKALRPPSTAEMIDALLACRDLKVEPGVLLDEIAMATLWKEAEIVPEVLSA